MHRQDMQAQVASNQLTEHGWQEGSALQMQLELPPELAAGPPPVGKTTGMSAVIGAVVSFGAHVGAQLVYNKFAKKPAKLSFGDAFKTSYAGALIGATGGYIASIMGAKNYSLAVENYALAVENQTIRENVIAALGVGGRGISPQNFRQSSDGAHASYAEKLAAQQTNSVEMGKGSR